VHVLPCDCFSDDHTSVLPILNQLVTGVIKLKQRFVLHWAHLEEFLRLIAANYRVFASCDEQVGSLRDLVRDFIA